MELAISLEDIQLLHELSSNQIVETGIKLKPILNSRNILQEPSMSSWKLGLARFVYSSHCMIGYERFASSYLKYCHFVQKKKIMMGDVCVYT